ncbi:hypothetical protein [Butyrivibrio sp. MC2013]|uniref:hypothetical protein n=1 Tax=Butyrivibrio sp. MC2013 TaxID=1280686 RepID=UPI0004005757|nr:hypothetical protein [Butyrivibrio sp. MC2013]
MKKEIIAIMSLIVTAGIMTACGKVKYTDESISKMEVSLDTPSGVRVEMTDNGQELTWDSVEGAGSYVIYKGSSRLSDDFEIVGQTTDGESSYLIDSKETDLYDYYKVRACGGKAVSDLSSAASYENTLFGDNTYIYSPQDDPEEVNTELKQLFYRQQMAQFEDKRFAVMFKPGEYDEAIDMEMGFYMDVMGLGLLPTDTVLPHFNCRAEWLGDDGNHNATCNFWRGVSNLTVNDDVMWAVSQATFMRRMQINGNLALHDNYGWASGGFLADSVIDGIADSGSQQQWLSRNCDWKMWTGDNWNIVFAGIADGKAPTETWPSKAYTDAGNVTVEAEKPYLYLEDGKYKVMVPDVMTDTKGVSWLDGVKGKSLPLSDFYIAHPEMDTAASINEALISGKNIFFTPGIYELDEAIVVDREDTIILGSGLASLRPMKGNVCMEVGDVDGVRIAGLLFDAWEEKSETLLRVGSEHNDNDYSADPVVLSDLFFRVGGVSNKATSVDNCVIINSNDVLGDNFWVWRADHGSGVAWDMNTAANGIIINGDRVKFYALMVEHFREYQTVWNGEDGLTVFYQSELPYDVPSQNEWRSHDGALDGYASYYVDGEVERHTAIGIGIYSYNRDAKVQEVCVMEAPKVAGMDLRNVCAVMITGNPGITHVIDNLGANCYTAGSRAIITDFQKELEKEQESKSKE